jgi:hypothetical protein
MNTPQRKYKTKDVDMLISASTIVEAAIANKEFLQSKRSTWQDPFFKDIQIQIDNVIQEHLGLDNAKELRLATQVIYSIQANALHDLAEVKIQIIEDFKDDTTLKNEILTQLGFSSYHKEAQKGDQEALINLLYQFKTNLSPALKTEIVTRGTAEASLDNVTIYADTLKNADVIQENNKGVRKVVTAEALAKFNEIYDKVISISKIANKFYKDNPALKQQFSFQKTSKTLNAGKKAKPAI